MTLNILDDNVQDQDTPVVDDNVDYLSALVGEDKKFKDVKDLARGKYEADLFIQNSNREKAELRQEVLRLREELTAREKLDELLDRLDTQRQPQLPNGNTPRVPEVNTPAVDLTQIKDLIQSEVQNVRMTERQEKNVEFVEGKLKDHFGNDYQRALRDQVSQLGLTAAQFNDMARNNPQLVLRALGVGQQRQTDNFQAPPRSSQRSDNFSPQTKERTWSYYQELKRTNPNRYFDGKTQLQMFEDMKRLGDKFEDGDFRSV